MALAGRGRVWDDCAGLRGSVHASVARARARHVPFMSRPYLQFRARFSVGIYPFVSGIRATRDPYSTPRVSRAKEEQTKKCREMFTKWGICYLGSFVVCEKIDW